MSERNLCAEIVQSGTWLYERSVPTDVWIVKQNFEYWYEAEFSDEPEQLNEGGETFQVLFVRGDRRILGPARLTLEEAVAAVEELVGQYGLKWTNHLQQVLFGGRNYSLTPKMSEKQAPGPDAGTAI